MKNGRSSALRVPRRLLVAATISVSAALMSSCASISLDRLPQPGASYRDGYDLVMEFSNVLNLPDRARVVMDGTPVGVVEKVKLRDGAVDVTARIDGAVQIPADIHAELRQATVLGDIFIALDRPPAGPDRVAPLAAGDRVPLAQTTSPVQLEDTIAQMANFVGSGSIQRVQNTIIGVNRVTPQRQEQVRAIADRVSRDLVDLSDNVMVVDTWLNGLAGTIDVMSSQIPTFQFWFSPTGMKAFDFSTNTGSYISETIPAIGSIYTGGFWMVPLLNSLGDAVGAVQQSKWAVEEEYRPWWNLFRNSVLPADKYPAMNIVSVHTADGREITENVGDVLRMIGAVP